jgi:hypothetical protein
MTEQRPHRRRRRRATAAAGAPPVRPPGGSPADAAVPPTEPPTDAAGPTATGEPAVAGPPRPTKPPAGRRKARETGADRGLRDLVGAGRSQVGVSGALRARDVNRPTPEDLAEAERDVVLVRRDWRPADPG